MQGLHSLNARTLEACCIQAIGFGRSLAITKLRWVMGVLRGRELVALDGRNGSGGPGMSQGFDFPCRFWIAPPEMTTPAAFLGRGRKI